MAIDFRRKLRVGAETLRWFARDLAHHASVFADGARPTRFAVMSIWDERQAVLGTLTGPNKASYCRRHGYTWLPFNAGFDPSRPVAWSKIMFIRRHLADYDWLMWSDADSAITNPAIRLENLVNRAGDLFITSDGVGLNSGSFLIRNCAWSQGFLREAWELPGTPAYHRHFDINSDRMWENRAFLMLATAPAHRSHVRIVPQRRLNSYPPEFAAPHPGSAHAPGDFVVHLPGLDEATRIRMLHRYLGLNPQP